MAKKIIKNPAPIECKVCKCVFEFTEQDIERTHIIGQRCIVNNYRYVTCPVCGERIKFE